MARAPGLADALRMLALDAVAAAGSGDAGLALRMAGPMAVLWSRFLKFDAADPRWPDRDRFVCSAAEGAVLLHALVHLTGHAAMSLEDLRRFRRLDTPACGQPDCAAHPAVEATTGPPGQGLANAVGMALAERLLAARFGRSLVDHRTWVVCGAGELADGLSQEAACLAGQLRLHRLCVLQDMATAAADVTRCFAAHGWTTRRVDGADPVAIEGALAMALRSRRPSLIACHTAALDAWVGGPRPPFALPEALSGRWLVAGARGAAPRRGWLKRLARHPQRPEFERLAAGRLPDGLHERIAGLKAELAGDGQAPERASTLALAALTGVLPELVGGGVTADRACVAALSVAPRPVSLAPIMPPASITPEDFSGRHLHYGARAHAMGGVMNGLALHGGLVPYGEATLVATDAMRPALRLAALMRLRVIHVARQDSIGLGADGPAAQPVEQLAGLRALPNLFVFRPACALETAECWDLALRRSDGPSLLALGGAAGAPVRRDVAENRSARGGYVLAPAEGARALRHATLIASGFEVSLALAARALLAAEGVLAAVVSLPCWELFAAQDESYRAVVLGSAPRFGIEAAGGFGWERWLGPDGVFIGLAGFGASGPAEDLYRRFGLTPEAIAQSVRRRLA